MASCECLVGRQANALEARHAPATQIDAARVAYNMQLRIDRALNESAAGHDSGHAARSGSSTSAACRTAHWLG
jgi:hypothetical protein